MLRQAKIGLLLGKKLPSSETCAEVTASTLKVRNNFQTISEPSIRCQINDTTKHRATTEVATPTGRSGRKYHDKTRTVLASPIRLKPPTARVVNSRRCWVSLKSPNRNINIPIAALITSDDRVAISRAFLNLDLPVLRLVLNC